MAHDPTYTNFQVARGSREDNNVYSNFCNHQRRSDEHRGKRGWTGEITCGGWTFLCGKACIFYFVLVISFLITLILLISCLVKIPQLATTEIQGKLNQIERKVSSLQTNMSDILDKLTKTQTEVPQLATTEILGKLNQIEIKVLSLATNVSDTLKELTETEAKVSSLATNVSDTLKELTETEAKASSLATNVSDILKKLTETQTEVGADMHCLISGSSCSGRCCSLSNQMDWSKADKLCPSIEVRLVTNNKGKEQVCPETNADDSNSAGTQYETTSVSGATTSSDDQTIN